MPTPVSIPLLPDLDALAAKINAHGRSAKNGTNVVLAVRAEHVITLGFDPGEWITEERLLRAVRENVVRRLAEAGDAAFDVIELLEMTDEV